MRDRAVSNSNVFRTYYFVRGRRDGCIALDSETLTGLHEFVRLERFFYGYSVLALELGFEVLDDGLARGTFMILNCSDRDDDLRVASMALVFARQSSASIDGETDLAQPHAIDATSQLLATHRGHCLTPCPELS